MDTILIAFLTAFVTILLNHLFEVYEKEKSQKRELLISFYSKIKKAEAEIFGLILRGSYGWGNVEVYSNRIGQSQIIYESILNEFYEQLLLNERERIKTREVIVSLWDNIISEILQSQTDGEKRKNSNEIL